jgi:hypothetical protein
MPAYRLCFIHRDNGTTAHRYPFEADDDAAAIAFSNVWKEDAPMELWRGSRKLKRWDLGGQVLKG